MVDQAYLTELEGCLSRFEQLARPGANGYRWSHCYDGGQHRRTLVVSAIIHGNEVGPLPGLVALMEALESGALQFGGRLTLLLGNPEAARQNRRFLEEDLNRVFVRGRPGTSHEHRRGWDLMPLLDEADLYLDFHQTIEATRQAFYIFPFSTTGWRWVRALQAAKVWVTRHPGQAFSSGVMCADEFVRARGRPGITVECGQKGFDRGAVVRVIDTVTRACALLDAMEQDEDALRRAAEAQPDVGFYQTVYRHRFVDAALTLRPGLANFEEVSEGEALHAPGTPSMYAPSSGILLFPKYPPREADGRARDPRPGEIYRILEPLEQHPSVLWPGV